ncbi:HNH endonuclease [Streptomyces sp. NBC_00038]|uniref:HNH endonuclease n=1 Tax=Streptomyces sp. NBC_00038 TaxID=2903615 RepID=UPI0022528911|nr:HNH endonuclease [Streptomyces sp. NBC_00038]MCX5558032.1 HNH endonuclease [Streptomyces sp. NBC_00038]
MSSGVQYTRERLIEAAAHCSDIDEVIVLLGTRPHRNLRQYLYQRFEHFGIDISHFPRRRRASKPHPKPTAEELRRAVGEATSVAGALRALGKPCTGQLRALFRRWVHEDSLDTTHFLGQAHQRGNPGPAFKRSEDVLVRHDGKRRTKTSQLRRALHEIGVPEKCAECGVGPEWLGKPMPLEVDHISGDWGDDRPENLRLLCPNCHAATSTWCRGGQRRTS